VLLFKGRRRRRLRSRPFPAEWRAILESSMPLYRRLPDADRAELEGHIQVFIAEKYFEGCNGLQLSDRIRVIIAAHAGLLLLHRDTDYYPLMRSILVYPAAFAGAGKSIGPAGIVTENQGWRSGESWHTPAAGGPVIISWSDTLAGASDPCDGRNVALHEFAHQLDAESGAVEGVPALDDDAAGFSRMITIELARLRQALSMGLPSAIDPYGATSPAELFAVAVETFFERPATLRQQHPALYDRLTAYFRQDPATWSACEPAIPGAVA
jgi:Mlc titration factor MtfA (ptsG expression regulator)